LTPPPISSSSRDAEAGRAVKLSLPKGDLRVARQFTAGFRFAITQVPKGRLNSANVMRLFMYPLLWQ